MRAITVADVGEFGLVDRLTSRFRAGSAARVGARAEVQLGPGDDAAVLATPDGRVVATTDLLVDGRHFRRDWSTAQDVGRKAAAQNLADVAAVGGVPTGLLVGLAVTPELEVEWLEGVADGLKAECDEVGAAVLGGDVVRSETLTLAVTALGDLGGRAPVTRAGAKPGDVVAVVGRLGWAAAGLAVLGRGFRSPVAMVAAHRRPEPPYAEGPRAAELGATAMVDVSDGLVADLEHVAIASSVGIELDTRKLDVPAKLRDVGGALGVDPMTWILGGGDDHALAATFPGSAPPPAPWRVIGRVARGRGVLVDGAAYAAPAGWDHFR
jgi:thiamine-monophosphate kinase